MLYLLLQFIAVVIFYIQFIAKQANILPNSLTTEEISNCVIKGKHFRDQVGDLETIRNPEGGESGFKVNTSSVSVSSPRTCA